MDCYFLGILVIVKILFVTIFDFASALDVRPPQYRLWHDLLKNYEKRIRPIWDPNSALNVTIGVHVDNVIDLDAKGQQLKLKVWIYVTWKDEFLNFDASLYGQDNVEGSSDDVWVPDLVLYESLNKEHPSVIQHPVLKVFADGTIKWIPVAVTESACKVNVVDYPFDKQVCNLTFGSWVHPTKHIHLIGNDTMDDGVVFVTSGEWDVAPLKCIVKEFDFGGEEAFDLLRCHLNISRKPLHYIVNMVVPCILLLIVGSFAFLLQVKSGEKVTLSVTILLALTVFILVLMENLPASSDGIPFLGKFVIACMILLAFSTIMAVSIVNMVARGYEVADPAPPSWLRTIVLDYLAKVVFCSTKKETENTSVRMSVVLPDQRISVFCHEDWRSLEDEGSNEDGGNDLSSRLRQRKNMTNAVTAAHQWIAVAKVIDRLYLFIYVGAVFIIIVTVFCHYKKI